jgi:hypothetical protein
MCKCPLILQIHQFEPFSGIQVIAGLMMMFSTIAVFMSFHKACRAFKFPKGMVVMIQAVSESMLNQPQEYQIHLVDA